jgi:two-component system, LuxR family, sensor kinase FixL
LRQTDKGMPIALRLAGWAGFLALFVALDWVSFVNDFLGQAITPWNPHTGAALAYLLHFGPANWPVVAVATLVSDLVIRDGKSAALLPFALTYAGLYGAAATLLRRSPGFTATLDTPRTLVLFLALALVSAFAVTFLHYLFVAGPSEVNATTLVDIFTRQWIGEMTGITIFAPLLAHVAARIRPPYRLGLEWVAQGLVTALILAMVFGRHDVEETQFAFLLFPPVIWVALRGGLFPTLGILALIQTGIIAATALRHSSDGTVIQLQARMLTLAVTGMLMAVMADTRRRGEAAMQERMGEMSRLGRLHATSAVASGLAHELKQPLLAVINYLGAARSLLGRAEPDVARAMEHLDSAADQVLRADETIRRIRAFVQKGETLPRRLRLSRSVRGALELCAPSLKSGGVRVDTVISTLLPAVWADEIQVLQIVVNLLSNAVQAISESGASERWIRISAQVDSSGMVRLSVADSGPGLSAEILPELYQPFTTSREGGIGIGLSLSRAMAEAQGGSLWHDAPIPGVGACFHLTLPTAKRNEDGKP